MLALAPSLAAWAVIPCNDGLVLTDINAGLLYIMAITSMGVYGVIIAGWASNSKYAFLGSLRSAAQIVAYEIAMGFALVTVLMVSQSLNLSDIVRGQGEGMFANMGLGVLSWNWLPLSVVRAQRWVLMRVPPQAAPQAATGDGHQTSGLGPRSCSLREQADDRANPYARTSLGAT